MRLLVVVAICAWSCVPVASAVRVTVRQQLSKRNTSDVPPCVRRFVDGPREHAKVQLRTCMGVDAFIDTYCSTAIQVTVKLVAPLDDLSRAALIEAGVPFDVATEWPSQVRERPTRVVSAPIDVTQLFCIADLAVVEEVIIEEAACSEPVHLL